MSFKIEDGVLIKYRHTSGETEVVIPDGVTKIGWSSFHNCTSLTSVTIPESVTEIGGWAFEGCKSLKNIIIPSSVKKIEEKVFYYCKSLTSVTISSYYSKTKIGQDAFKDCKSLTNVKLPNNITKIDINAFESTPWFENLCKNNNGFVIVNNILIEYKGNEIDIVIPENVEEIKDYAFFGCKTLKSITIPDSVKVI